MPRTAGPKRLSRGTVAKKAAAPRAANLKSKTKPAAPRLRNLKENASQLEVAERMLAEIASREQADTDPTVAAQRALRAAILSGAVAPSTTILTLRLKAAPAGRIVRKSDRTVEERLADETEAKKVKIALLKTTTDAATAAAASTAKSATITELLRRLAEISTNTGLSAIEPAEIEAAKEEERAAREKKAAKRLEKLKEKAIKEEAMRREAEDVMAARMTEKARREKARDDAEAEATRKIDELRALEAGKIKLAISKAEAERIQREHTAETIRLIDEIKSSKGGDPTDIIYDATTGLPVSGYKRTGSKKNAPAVALKNKLNKVEIVKRENKYYIGGDPSATILNRNRAIPTELIADYDPAEEERLDREMERAAEEARVLKEIAEKRLEESKVTPSEYPKIETDASVTPGRPKPAFLGDIGDVGKVKLTPKDERKLPTFTPKKPTHEDMLAAAIAKALAGRRVDIKDLTDEEIAAKDKEDALKWDEADDPPKTPIKGSGRKSKSEIQAVGFPQDEWTPAQARRWLKEHGAVPIKPMRREGSWLRWRITPPSYGSYTTKTLRSNGRAVHLILGH